MPLDAQIPLMAQPIELNSPLNMLARATGVQNMLQQNRLQGMQMQDMHEQRAMQLEQARARQQFLANLPDPPEDAPQHVKMLVPLVRAGLVPAEKLFEAMSPKVVRTIEIKGPDGKPYTVQADQYGRPVGQNLPKWVEPKLANLGGTEQVYDPTAVVPGQSFAKTMAPGEAQRIDIERTKAGAATRQAAAAEDANAIQRGLKNEQLRLENEALQRKASDAATQKQTAVATMEDSLRTLDAALTHPGRETATGVSGVVDPRNYIPATEAKNYQILADQIKGKAFLQAFESLKGGGQITEVEGKKATDAIARLDRAQSDAEYAKALKDFRGVIAGAYKRATGKDYMPVDAGATSVRDQADAILRGGK